MNSDYEITEARRAEATRLIVDGVDLWDEIAAKGARKTKLNFRIPRSEITRTDGEPLKLLLGLKLRRGLALDPHGDVPGQAANALIGVAAELVELANKISEIPPVTAA